MIIDNNFGNLCMKKADRFKKRGFHLFQSSMGGGGLTPEIPPLRTPLLWVAYIHLVCCLFIIGHAYRVAS